MVITYTEQPIDPAAHAILLRAAHPDRGISWHEAVASAFAGSSYVASAWDDDTLVGTVRVVDDGVAFALIADLLVHPSYRQQGIGKTLVTMCQRTFANFFVYADPADEAARRFYLAIGFHAKELMLHRPSEATSVDDEG